MDGNHRQRVDCFVRFFCEIFETAPGHGELGVDILEACNCLDETVEWAPYDGISSAAALDCFGLAGDPPLYRLLGLAMQKSPRRFDGRLGLRRGERLPVLPKQARRLLALSGETATYSDLESIAGSDAVLAASLVGRANSALSNRLKDVTGIRDAIVFLGIPVTHAVLVAASFQALFASATLKLLWQHASEAAERTRSLAIAAGGIDADEAYLAGLLHDIGRLVIERFPQEPRAFELELLDEGFPRVYAEAFSYRIDHAELGAELLRCWQLPESLVNAVRYHHRPEASGSRLASLLYLQEVLHDEEVDALREDLPSLMRRCKAESCAGITLDQFLEQPGEMRRATR